MPTADECWMARALELARRGVALAHPNPMVGAVVVKNNAVAGEAFHTWGGVRHAEVLALERAGSAARGATLYVTLEPCCHTGRTGPCTDSIVRAGVVRVVAAMRDPNPAVSGRGLARLRRAGVRVATGVLETEARRLNEDFARWVRTGRPLVTLKSALSLDGRIAAREGSTTRITSLASRKFVQQLRHSADALLTGIGTVCVDNPRLTDRTGLPRTRPLVRVILDTRLRLPVRSRIVREAKRDVLVFTCQSVTSARAQALARAGIEVVRVRQNAGRVDLRAVLEQLGRRQILNVLLEGGAQLNGAALAERIVDKLVFIYAPTVLGARAVPFASGDSFKGLPPLRNVRVGRIGPDFLIEGYLREP